MSGKRNGLQTLAFLASAAAMAAAVYNRREEIRAIVSDAALRFSGSGADAAEPGTPTEELRQEIDVIIDVRDKERSV